MESLSERHQMHLFSCFTLTSWTVLCQNTHTILPQHRIYVTVTVQTFRDPCVLLFT